MTKVVTVRVVLDDDRVEEFLNKLDSREILAPAIDSVVETHGLPKFIADSIVEEKYASGDFNKPLNVYVTGGYPANSMKIWDVYSMDDLDKAIPYKYDTLPVLTDAAQIVYARED